MPWPVQEQKINTMPERPICEFTVCTYFLQLVPWLVQEQKINTTEFERERFVSLRLRIFLTAGALAGTRAIN